MTPACISEPVSWLALEQLALGELPAARARAVQDHLARCPACRACLDRIEADAPALPALPALPARGAAAPPAVAPWWRAWWPRLAVGGGLAAAAAAAVLLVARAPNGDGDGGDRGPTGEAPTLALAPAGPRVAIKAPAGEVVIALAVVRERAGHVEAEAASIAPDDRLKVRLTCPPAGGARLHADVVVFQRGAGARLEAAFPLPARTITCGNEVTLDGAFRVTPSSSGARDATVCVALDPAAAPDRAALAARGPRGPGLACVPLAAE